MPRTNLVWRAMLAIALMVGFYGLALATCAFLGALVWIDLSTKRAFPKLWIGAAITIGVLLWNIVPRATKSGDPGLRLDESGQPRLWKLVRQVAAAAGQAPPDAVYLVSDVNAFVVERGRRFGFGGKRLMGIGLPLLQVLTVPQLRSVLAHEFGHFHGGDTRLAPFIYRTRIAIGRTVAGLGGAQSLLQKPFEWYGLLYLKVTFAISRAQELAADALAVRLCGLEPVTTALRRVNEVGPLYEHYLQNEFVPALQGGRRPPMAEGFARYLASPGIRQLSTVVGERAMQAEGDSFDTHPPLSERLAAAEAVEGAPPKRAAGPAAIALLDGVDEVELALLRRQSGFAGIARLPAASWDEASVPTVLAHWDAAAADVAARLPDLKVSDFAGLGPRLADLAKVATKHLSTGHRREAGARMLSQLLGRALARNGWRVETGVGEPILLVKGEDRIDPNELGARLCDGVIDVAWWRGLGERHGFAGIPLAGAAAAPPA